MAVLACFAAWLPAWQQTRDLQWPCENDLFRDMGAAQSFLDGQGGADPAYLGERWWYNPLVPSLVGALSRILSVPLHQAYATFGAHLNLAAPLAFYVMMAVLVSRRAALAGLVGFLFLGPNNRVSWLHATYSPWLWTCNFAQSLLYVTVTLAVLALRKSNRLWAVGAGVATGATFLAHTAPAALIVVASSFVLLVQARFRRRAPRTARRAIFGVPIIWAVACVTSAPFLIDVVLHLMRGMRNPTPAQWVAGELSIEYLPDLLKWHTSFRGILALFGLAHLVLRGRSYARETRLVLIGLAIAILLGLGYGYASQRIKLPTFLPSWHFYFYLHALESALFGIAFAVVGTALVRLVAAMRSTPDLRAPSHAWVANAICVALISAPAAWTYGQYRNRMDLTSNRRDALAFNQARTTEIHGWILEHTSPNDVFLSDNEVGFYGIMSAGRKVIALQDLFSNPFVDVAARAGDAQTMFELVRSGQWGTLTTMVPAYELRYIALSAAERGNFDEKAGPKAIRRIFSATDSSNGIDLYAVAP